MKTKLLTLAVGIAVALTAQADKELSFERQLSLEAGRVNGLEIDAGAGHMEVVGADVDVITVDARIISKKYKNKEDLVEAFEDKMDFYLKRDQGFALLKASNQNRMMSFSNPEISIHLTVQVPQSFDLVVDDGSGHIKISDIDGSVEIDDGSGHIELSNIKDDVEIDDGSGSVTAKNLAGDFIIDDGSGEIKLKHIGGHVAIEDGSGKIQAKDIAGDFKVDDGSGSIEVSELQGEFILVDDGSGGIKVNGKTWSKK